MKRTTLLLKSLLLAVGLLAGSNVWADTYNGTVAFNAQNRITNNNNGTFTAASNAGNQYALALADLSGLANISSATSVTLDFDVTIPSGGRLLIGIGDKNTRGTTAGTSSKSTYDTNGLIMRYGTKDGTYVRVDDGTNNSNLKDVSSHVTFSLDRTTGKYSYTITYVDGESVTQTGLSGSNISTDVSNATIVEAYTWLSSATFAISDVTYSYEYSASSFDYTINAVDGEDNIIKELASGKSTEAVNYYYPYAIEKDGVYYTTSAGNFVAEATSLNKTVNVVYTRDESIVGFYEESAAGTNSLYSNGAYTTVAAQNARNRGISAGKLAPGVYKFMGRLVADGNSGRAITIREGSNDPMASLIGTNSTKYAEAEFTVEATTGNLYVNGANSGEVKTNLSTSFDYVLVKCLSVSVTISSAGWATFYSPVALDFAKTIGLTAYTATVDGATVELTEVSTVPANTGVVLMGDEGSYNISVIASSDTDKGDLKGNATEATEYDEDYTRYYLAKNLKNEVQFTKLNKDGSIAAGKAYLEIANAGSVVEARTLNVVFAGETTAIDAIANVKEQNGEVYNLAGQRVAKPAKGLYIVSGKKVIIK